MSATDEEVRAHRDWCRREDCDLPELNLAYASHAASAWEHECQWDSMRLRVAAVQEDEHHEPPLGAVRLRLSSTAFLDPVHERYLELGALLTPEDARALADALVVAADRADTLTEATS